jgi:hypothetical protein
MVIEHTGDYGSQWEAICSIAEKKGPAHHRQISEVRLPEFVASASWILKAVGGLEQDVGWALDQVCGLQDSINARLREKFVVPVRDPAGCEPSAGFGPIGPIN